MKSTRKEKKKEENTEKELPIDNKPDFVTDIGVMMEKVRGCEALSRVKKEEQKIKKKMRTVRIDNRTVVYTTRQKSDKTWENYRKDNS